MECGAWRALKLGGIPLATTWARETEKVVEGRVLRLADRPITFEEFLDMTGEDDDFELVNGMMVERMSAQYPHERRFAWLFSILYFYVRKRELGVVLGSRSAVEINEFAGRLPDILFVRAERQHVIQDRALYAAPDLVIEIVSPNDTRGDLVALEADYCSIGVPEIVFWNAQKRHLTVSRKRDEGYTADTLTDGEFHSETVPGFHLDVLSLFLDPLPDEFEVLNGLLAEAS